MRRYGRYRYGPRPVRPWRPFRGAIWLMALLFLFLFGHWWFGILLLIVVGIVLESLYQALAPRRPQNPPPVSVPFPPPAAPAPAPKPVDPIHRTDLLPATCPQCGGPIRPQEVKWTGSQSAACPFCGSNLPMGRR